MSAMYEPGSPAVGAPGEEQWIARAIDELPGSADHQRLIVDLPEQRLCLTVAPARHPEEEWPAFAEAASRRAALRSDELVPLVTTGNTDGKFYAGYDIRAAASLSEYRMTSELTTARCLAFLVGISRALDEAVSQGRPPYAVPPDSVFVEPRHGAVVTDLGLAREVLGNPPAGRDLYAPWVAPEVLEGDGVDNRSAVFSFGALTYTLLTDAPPTGTPLTELRPDLPHALEVVLGVAMAPHPAKRYGTASEARHLVNLVIHGATSSVGVEPPRRFRRRATKPAPAVEPVEKRGRRRADPTSGGAAAEAAAGEAAAAEAPAPPDSSADEKPARAAATPAAKPAPSDAIPADKPGPSNATPTEKPSASDATSAEKPDPSDATSAEKPDPSDATSAEKPSPSDATPAAKPGRTRSGSAEKRARGRAPEEKRDRGGPGEKRERGSPTEKRARGAPAQKRARRDAPAEKRGRGASAEKRGRGDAPAERRVRSGAAPAPRPARSRAGSVETPVRPRAGVAEKRAPSRRSHAERARPRLVPALWLGAALVLGALAGTIMGDSGDSSPSNPDRVRAEGLSAKLPEGWEKRSGTGGLSAGPTGSPGSGLTVTVDDSAVASAEQTTPVKLGSLEAWRAASAGQVRYVIPTRSGKVVATCTSGAGAGAALLATCERAASTLRLGSVTNVPLETVVREEGERWRLAVGRLRVDRSAGLRRLAQASRRTGQALVAESLARAYERAERRFAPLPGGEPAVSAARATARAYRSLAAAARAGSSRRWNAARAEVRRREAALARTVARA